MCSDESIHTTHQGENHYPLARFCKACVARAILFFELLLASQYLDYKLVRAGIRAL